MRSLLKYLQLIALFSAFLLEAAVLYFPADPNLRLFVGLLLILPITWIVARTGVVEMIVDLPDAVKKRRFTGLRKHVMQLLDEIRRLNWMAVDAERGFRSHDDAMREMDAIEERLQAIISEIRRTAGRRTPEADLEVEVTQDGSVEAPEASADEAENAADEADSPAGEPSASPVDESTG